MRLETLDVHGFGGLGELRCELAPGLTVVVGSNESGKSTVHRAIRAALYGIDAGGQGRAAARSEWARWRPWDGDRYGVAVTYALADGRRFRVARRLEQREERTQVQELGGRDVTDSLRAGRLVVPGLHHLGIDEAVFCASAWVSEEGLEAAAPDCPTARADSIQEAIERLADAAGRATAGEALARLRAAMDRVGTENRSGSVLGRATARLRVLDEQLGRIRLRLDELETERQRLDELEERDAIATRARVDAERQWIEARLAQIGTHRDELAAARDEMGRLEESVAGWQAYATFPVEREERVTSCGVELRLALDAEGVARRRWDIAREEVRAGERRRAEIATAVRALGAAPRVGEQERAEAAALGAEVAGEAAVERRVDAAASAGARLDGLRREVAATGLGAVPVGKADEAAGLVEIALGAEGARQLRGVAWLIAATAFLAGGGLLAAHMRTIAMATAAALLVAALLVVLVGRFAGGPGAEARRRLSRLAPGLDLGAAGLERAAQRLPRLRALHEDVRRQEALVDAAREELAETSARLAALAQRCLVLAARLPVEVGAPAVPPVGPVGQLLRARQALAAVSAAAEAGHRRAELEEEDARIADRLLALGELSEEAERCSAVRERLGAELERLCAIPGVAHEDDPDRQVAAFRQAAATRRNLDAARARLVEVRRRITALGPADDAALARQHAQLAGELRARGGDPGALVGELPLEPGRLHTLELTAQRASQEAALAATRATAMRERLLGTLDGLPVLADLEDERAACMAVRDRCLHQLAALRCAAGCVEEAARRVHRDVAPRLAGAIGRHLDVLTEGRYQEVHVDPERFAVTLRGAGRLELVPVDLLSHGTRDQVSLLLRLALAEVFGGGGEPVPLLLDDPLQSSDPLRRSAMLDMLVRLAGRTQVILTTTDPAVAEAVTRSAPESAVVHLGRRREASAAPRARALGTSGR